MKLAKQGDIYFPGLSDYMEPAKRQGCVFPETEKYVVYLVNAINVQKSNLHNIRTLTDFTRPGIKVAIANPEGVCVGAYAVEIIKKNFTPAQKEAFKRNLINYTGSCEKTDTAVSLKQADAVIGWRVFEHWDPERIETVALDPAQISRIGYIAFAVFGLYVLLIASLGYFFEVDQVRQAWASARTLFTLQLSLAAATLAAACALSLAVPAAYALSRFEFRGRLLVDTILEFPIIVSPAALGHFADLL